ncbi:heterokaryon incompatibility protein-domain-containing protein [Plectosphaerella plurivora]|uniref:Heterokaryon incompatibility protein-domain-containing protein n=1 Tax=Plectosphaerella plurivora TaxID=936078 RepID=A0A9P8VP70_9PEZI|nr:heterokaryon incompatibility protein-domain-containing protein [Plectosphaerella plurivora]
MAARSGDITGRQLLSRPDSEEAYAQIESWLAECTARHPECQKQDFFATQIGKNGEPRRGRGDFPTRLLCIEDDCLRLLDGPGVTDEYVALSYCWGTSGQLTTTTGNIAAHRRGIPFADVPLTQRQAAAATRKLGMRYLWVDALCIVQDDKDDWGREAPQMGLIYHNASVTIAAAGSSSSAGGLFHQRTARPAPVSVPYQSSTGERTMLIAPLGDGFVEALDHSVWNSRGWVYQERILSRRIVEFSTSQIFFECQRHSIGEDGLPVMSIEKRLAAGRMLNGLESLWCGLIQGYTARSLTCADDRTMAIESLARYVAGRTDTPSTKEGMYCAGAWLGKSPCHLLWYCSEGLTTKGPSPRAPTWSWGSVDVPVQWETSWYVFGGEVVSKLELPSDVNGLVPTDKRVQTARLRVEAPAIVLQRADKRMGLVKNSEAVSMGMGPYEVNAHTHPGCYQILSSAGDVVGWGVFDRGYAAPKSFLAAILSTSTDEEETLSHAVLLTAAGKEADHFVRIGVGEIRITVDQCARRNMMIT